MKRHKRIVLLFICLSILFAEGCAKKEKFVEPYYILQKWCRAIKDLNYKDYSQCEAYPKSYPVFREAYGEYFLSDLTITAIQDFDEDNVRKDPEGNSYHYRRVDFECTEVNRKTNRPMNKIQGDVLFILFTDDSLRKEGWLMSNRTLVRVKR
jgi:hypothetical protein